MGGRQPTGNLRCCWKQPLLVRLLDDRLILSLPQDRHTCFYQYLVIFIFSIKYPEHGLKDYTQVAG